MKFLKLNEIKFIKETGWTPTVYQCREYDKTIWADLCENKDEEFCMNLIDKEAREEYAVDVHELYQKCTSEYDGITLEYDAVYLFYTFFTKEELEKLTDEEATRWLKDFKYYSGYRKWDSGNLVYVNEALEVYNGQKEFYEDHDGEVWTRDIDTDEIEIDA